MANNNTNSADAKYRAALKAAELERRQLNTKGIMGSIILMLAVGVADTLGIFGVLAWLFASSPWAEEARTAIYLLEGIVFIGAGLFGLYSTKQNSG
jgi:hypothetical protein